MVSDVRMAPIEHYFDDIEPAGGVDISVNAEKLQRSLLEATLLSGADPSRRRVLAAHVGRFYLDKDIGIAIEGDDVDLPVLSSITPREDDVVELCEELRRHRLACYPRT